MTKTAILLSNKLVKIDNALKEVYKLSGGRQRILFYKEMPFDVLVKVEHIIKDCRVMAGRSWIFHMANCTITIRRKH